MSHIPTRLSIVLTSFILAIAVLANLSAVASAHEPAQEIFDATNVLLNSLDELQKSALQFEFENQLRKDWQFVPLERQGLSFAAMKPNQRLLAMSLIQTALSQRGFTQTMQIMALEQVLHELENGSAKRNPEKYHLFLFGKPSLAETWGWRIEGHHLSISFTLVDGQTIVSTPAFMGANPGEVKTGSQIGLRPLGAEEDLGRQLIKSLNIDQKKKAIVSETAPQDVVNGPGRAASPTEPAGIAASDLSDDQQKNLRSLMELYVNKLRPELAASDLKKIDEASFDKIHFAWAGQLQPGKPHYYRIQGPTFIMEYDNTQNNANHVHTLWRDFKNDFGDDLLQRHYQTQRHN